MQKKRGITISERIFCLRILKCSEELTYPDKIFFLTLILSDMKNFDLNEFGVKEMDKKQLIDTNGGGPIEDLLFAIFTL
jgi:hypothetical protein